MTRSELKRLIKETINEEMGGISPQVKQKMVQRLQAAIKHVQDSNDMETLASMDGAEYDQAKGTFSVQIYNNRTDR
jgi:hypothetical protein